MNNERTRPEDYNPGQKNPKENPERKNPTDFNPKHKMGADSQRNDQQYSSKHFQDPSYKPKTVASQTKEQQQQPKGQPGQKR